MWWLPLLLVYAIVVIWHWHIFGFVSILSSRLLYAALIYYCARLIGLSSRHLWVAGVLGCVLYGSAGYFDYLGFKMHWPVLSGLHRYFAESGTYRVGLGGNPITFGSFAVWMMGIAITGLLQMEKPSKRDLILGLGAAALALMAAILTQSRGPLLGLLPLMGIVVFFIKPSYRFVAVTGPVVAGVLAITLFHFVDPGNRFDRVMSDIALYFAHGKAVFSTIGARFEMWDLVGMGLSKSPLMGPGVATVADLAKQLPGSTANFGDMLTQHHFHNL